MAQVRKQNEGQDGLMGGLGVAACALIGAFVGVLVDNLMIGIILGSVFGVALSLAKKR